MSDSELDERATDERAGSEQAPGERPPAERTPEPRTTFERALARQARAEIADETTRAQAILAHGRPRRRPWWRRATVGRVVFVVMVAIVVRVALFSGHGRRGTEPIDAGASAEGAGLGSSAASFLPDAAAATPEPAPAPLVAPTPVPTPLPQAPTRAARPRRVARAPVTPAIEPALPARAVDVPATPAPTPTPTPRPQPVVLNIGTRIAAALEAPVRTGATLAPATALIASDVRVSERVVLPAGTRLVGSAFATTGDDRVQIVWRAAVVDGRTHRLAGEALSADGSQGLTGKVVKKKGKGVLRRIGAAVLGTAGETLGYGVPGGDGIAGLAEDALAGRAGRELVRASQEREWLQADKIIELKAGAPLVVYVSSDTVIASDGPPR